MSTTQISRRYAVALFELIGEGVNLREDLAKAATIVALDEVSEVVASPEYPASLKQDVVVTAVGEKIAPEVERLLAVLAEREKLSLLPEISALVEEMIRLAESEIDAEVTVAAKLNKAIADKLTKALEDTTGKKVRVSVTQDKAILGGMVVRIGDRKIDYSLRSKLAGLHRVLAS
ncbi:F0F1 ATP synthase subunit delta [Mariprofundus sp. EBB-1]|uniref:F0F1 ATP synthase subunit delta n=1 Tax=Mariprofundus sp. EBB-1 TaxID=2650971 RepID=UPI000EF27803|nr:F0F1 ATP synthase subunit delta [Mariprofundus sp. EBB-1]RLL54080.1 F0F1 ATP synthase subunit delta [Mariprofundus sp. EBB-1]